MWVVDETEKCTFCILNINDVLKKPDEWYLLIWKNNCLTLKSGIAWYPISEDRVG